MSTVYYRCIYESDRARELDPDESTLPDPDEPGYDSSMEELAEECALDYFHNVSSEWVNQPKTFAIYDNPSNKPLAVFEVYMDLDPRFSAERQRGPK